MGKQEEVLNRHGGGYIGEEEGGRVEEISEEQSHGGGLRTEETAKGSSGSPTTVNVPKRR